MLEVYERLGSDSPSPADHRLMLSHEQRDKGRLRTVSTDGEEVRLFLERGSPLAVGEYLKSRCGRLILVTGAEEEVVTATCEDWRTFSRACYHLGNRHVKVEVGERRLSLLPDHVLEHMLVGLGMTLRREKRVFMPESGAYNHGHHHH